MDIVEQLISRAFHRGRGLDANPLIAEVRAGVAEAVGQAHNFEVSLLGQSPEILRAEVAFRFRLFLEHKRLTADRCSSVFVTLFHGEEVIFIHGHDFAELVLPPDEAERYLPVPVVSSQANLTKGKPGSLTADLVPNLTADLVPNLTPDLVPNLTPDLIPNLTPDLIPNLTPNLTPNLILDDDET